MSQGRSEPTPPAAMNVAAVLQQALAHHQAGRLQQAEPLYRAVLEAWPKHLDANHNLGVLAMQLNQPEVAVPHLKAALDGNPALGQYWLSYIAALIQAGQGAVALQVLAQGRQRGLQGEAVETLARRLGVQIGGTQPRAQDQEADAAPTRAEISQMMALFSQGHYAELEPMARSLTLRFPQHGFGWQTLAAVLRRLGRTEEALASMQKAAALLPEDHNAHYELGNTLWEQGRLSEAEASYRRALELMPDFAMAHNNLGVALLRQGRLTEAEASLGRALEIQPNDAAAHCNLGIVLEKLGRSSEAEASFHRSLEIRPDFAEVHNGLGNLLQQRGQLDTALASFRRALEIRPDYAEAHNNLGAALQEVGQLDQAVASCRRALELKSDYADAHNNLGNALADLGQLDAAVASTRRALELRPDFVDAHSNLLFLRTLLSVEPAPLVLAEARRYGELVGRQARPYTVWRSVPEPARCLRVGLVSGDLCQHPVGNFLESVLAALTGHASTRIELFAYHTRFHTDAVTERIRACCHGWFSAIAISDENLARRIRDDGIDILIDLAGHTAYNRLPLFAWKPAPVQASWLGYLGTTGVSAIDYVIADPWTLPESQDANFTEKIWRLPESYLCFTPPGEDVAVSLLPALAKGSVTFGCFNNLSKVGDGVVALWARILESVPESRLFLKAKQLEEASVRQHIVARFAAHGVGADRLLLKSFVPRAQYLAPYHEVDIALDPFPYPGISTSVEALWMGVPVLTLAGESFVSRQGVGVLMNAGLAEWVAADPDDYLARAVSHASDLQRLAKLRNGLRQQALASPIFDAPRFARHFEAAMRGMWRRWCDQQQGKLTLGRPS